MLIGYEEVLGRLKEERKRWNLTQAEFSRMLEIEQSHYSKVERGMARLTYYEVQRLYEVGIDVDYVITGYRFSSKNVNLLGEKSYSELLLILNILYIWIEYQYKNGLTEFDINIFNKTEYMKFIRFSYSENKNAIFLLRKLLGYTQFKMAELLGVDVKKLRALETGKTLPDSEIVWKLYADFYILPAVVVQSKEGLTLEICSVLDTLGDEEITKLLSSIQDISNLFDLFMEMRD